VSFICAQHALPAICLVSELQQQETVKQLQQVGGSVSAQIGFPTENLNEDQQNAGKLD